MHGLLAGLAGQRYADRLEVLMEVYRGLDGPVDPSLVVVDLVDGCGVLEYQARSRFFSVYRTLCDGAVLPEWMEARRKAA